MAYKRVTEEERWLIDRWRQAGASLREVARRLGRAASSISRERLRHTGGRGDRPQQSHAQAQAQAKRPGPRRFTETVRGEAEARLKTGGTPERIGQRARLEGRPWVCQETIDKSIDADAKAGGTLGQPLPRAPRQRQRRCPRQEGRGRIPNQRRIDTRPAEVETRQSVGHWEGDLINGAPATGNLVTLVERHARLALIGRTGSQEAAEVTQTSGALFEPRPPKSRLSLTLDNGKEFARPEELARDTRLDVSFARPDHSWERGTNENTNGLIRRLDPKKSSFAGMGEAGLQRIDTDRNDRPRRCLGWLTPREKMTIFLGWAP